MNKNSRLFLDIAQVQVKVYPGSILVLHLSIHSQMTQSWLFRAAIDDWLTDNGQIMTIPNLIDPPFTQLLPDSNLTQTVTFFIPSNLRPGQVLTSWLRFPALAEESVAIEAEILASTQYKEQPQVEEAFLSVTLPLSSQQNILSTALDRTTSASFGLISGLMDLDQIPSRWLVAELLVVLCQVGTKYMQTAPGRQLLNQLQGTRFFENGVKTFAYVQVPNWIANSLNSADQVLGNESLLSIWEQWLCSLTENMDVGNNPETTPKLAKVVVSELGGSADRWFAGIVLGLALISPRFATFLTTTTHSENILMRRLESTDTIQAIKHLSSILQSLDILPSRWLAIELLLLVCQRGNQYAQTNSGSQLLQQLRSTRWFHNGVLAFGCAQVPRWVDVSHQAAIAYQASVGSPLGQGGLLDVAQQWLWSLGLTDLKMISLKNELSISAHAVDALIASLGMDAQAWFDNLVLGLALVSPKIASLCAAEISTHLGPENILQQKGSLQR